MIPSKAEIALAAIDDELKNAKRIFVAYSGGLDSTVLLHLTCAAGYKPLVLHANHQLQESSDAWAEHCRRVCAGLEIPFEATTLTVKPAGRGLEAAAREARYAWFASKLDSGDLLLLAHHQDDQVETVMLRLLRGSGPRGLAAMRASRSLGAAQLLRPLLTVPKSELSAYALEQGLTWIEDPSNDDADFDRNFLRNEIFPRLEEHWPGYRKTISRSAVLCAETQRDSLLPTSRTAVGDPALDLSGLPQDSAAAREMLRAWLQELNLPMPSAAKLSEFVRQLAEGTGAQLRTKSWTLERYRQRIICRPSELKEAPAAIEIADSYHGEWLGSDRLIVSAAGIKGNIGPCWIRTRRPGDQILTAGGHSSAVKDLFQKAGVAPFWRSRVPLLGCGEGHASQILAVGPFCYSPLAKASGITVEWRAPTIGAFQIS
ncbi:MAG: tRNA lysidine(34) synthetase TilS [Pseudomonadota bacterium]